MLQTLYASCQDTLGAFDASQRVNSQRKNKASLKQCHIAPSSRSAGWSDWFGLARGYAYRCRRTIAIAAIMPKGIRMKSAMRMPIAKPFASGERPGGTATNRVSQSSSFMVPRELRIQYTDIAAVTD
jgi:hypothetical protein